MKFARALLVATLLGHAAVSAQSPDEHYIRIYQTIQDADRLGDAGQARAAAAKYVEAQENLRRFQSIYPGWNERVINYRLNYIASKLAPLTSAIAGSTPAPAAPPAQTNMPATPQPAVVVQPTPTPASTIPAPTPATNVPPAAVIPENVQQQIAALQAEVGRLRGENNLLGAKLKEALSVQPAAVDPRELAKAEERARLLEKENDLLKVRLRSTSASPAALPAGDSVAELKTKIAEQAEVLAAVRAENDILKKQTADLRTELSSRSATVTTAPSADDRDKAIRRLNDDVVALQKERALLKQLVEDRDRQLASAGKSAVTTDTQRQIETLRARLEVLEAKPIPYTAEEVALLAQPGAVLAANVATPATASQPPPAEDAPKRAAIRKEIPAGAGPLVAAAERAFALRNFAEAEKKYLDVLRQDESNVSILANLASTQLELDRLDEAEKTARKALALDPDDYFALYVLGRIKFRQDKLDEAFDALSRSAKANPDYAETQNYLGIVLSEKGLRIPAETALRRAVQLHPNHAAAHNNLAVVYATQKPPALALARWHYQRALSAGHPKNAELEKLLSAAR